VNEIIDEQVAVSERHASRLAGLSVRRLRAWAGDELIQPSIQRQLSDRNTVRLYTFGDLIELLVAAALVDAGRSTQQIRRVVEHLRHRDYLAPLRELRFAVSGDQIYFQHPDGSWEGDRAPDQIVLWEILDLQAIKARIHQSVRQERTPLAGHIERRRGVMGRKPVFAGTRVPVAAVAAYLDRGLPNDRILEAFPELTPEDLEAARRFLTSA